MYLNLTGKNALVGGGSQGLGKACAIELATLGANITLVSRSAEKLSETKKLLDTSLGQKHDFLVADYSNPDDLQKKVHLLVQTKNIHILINNTGGPPGGPIVQAEPAEFLSAFQNHLICNHLLAQAVLPGMKAGGYGRIINIVSTSVRIPIDGLGVSNTTRGAVAGWAKTLANEVAPFGITVNNVLPGSTETDRLFELLGARAQKAGISFEEEKRNWLSAIPMKRFGKPHEIATAVAFLASPAAAYITGVSLPVDGGKTKCI
ncbi:MAG: SDR family oxidoreductase [Bacteroidetes bacterium]|nr:MAG: SDR family oxidoreductase [Bacteroidota bacterium]